MGKCFILTLLLVIGAAPDDVTGLLKGIRHLVPCFKGLWGVYLRSANHCVPEMFSIPWRELRRIETQPADPILVQGMFLENGGQLPPGQAIGNGGVVGPFDTPTNKDVEQAQEIAAGLPFDIFQ